MSCTIHRRVIFLLAALSFIARQSAEADPIIFTIDKALSSVTLTGNDDEAGYLGAQPQNSNSNKSSANGHFYVDFDPFEVGGPSSMQFVAGHGFMNYDTQPSLLPNLGPGNFAISSGDGTVQYKLANTVWDFGTVAFVPEDPYVIPGAVQLDENNSIPATSTGFILNGAIEHISHPTGSRVKDYAGKGFADLFTAGTWTLEEDAPGLWTLTGSNIEYTGVLENMGATKPLGSLTYAGTIVAHAAFGADNVASIGAGASSGSALGGAIGGGLDVEFTNVTAPGSLAVQSIDTDGLSVAALAALSSVANFKTLGDTPQIWDIGFTGEFTDGLNVTFPYDPNQLGDVAEEDLFMWHFDKDLNAWEKIYGVVDTGNHTITIATSSLSPFAYGVPEPSTLALAAFGLGALAACGWRRRKR